jgi:hypothetical protein
MTTEDNSQAGSVSWFPYILVVIAIVVIGFVVLSVNENKKTVVAAANSKSAVVKDAAFKSLTAKNATAKTIKLPYAAELGPKERFSVEFTLTHNAKTSSVYNFIFDDCAEKIVVNDKEIKLTEAAKKDRCNWSKGFDLDLKEAIKEGDNKVYVEGINDNGIGGFKINAK